MHYNNVSIKGINYVDEHRAELMEYNRAITLLSKYTINPLFEIIPCWSLAALLNILSNMSYSIDEDANVTLSSYKTVEWDLSIHNSGLEELFAAVTKSDPIDACVEMIIKLHKETKDNNLFKN